MTIWISLLISALTLILSVLISLVSVGTKVGKYTEKIEASERNHSGLLSEIQKIKSDVQDLLQTTSKLEGFLIPQMHSAYAPITKKRSPRVLNSLGLKIYQDMRGEDFLVKNKDVLFAYIDNKNPKTALDVETYAREACASVIDMDIFNPIKNFIYNYPTQKTDNGDDYEVTIGSAVYVLTIPLRDMYLSLHPDILGEA